MTETFPNLFSPLAVGSYTLRNRIMNTGHAAHHQLPDGTPSEAYVHYLRERAKGGAGIIVTGHTVPVYDGETTLAFTNFHDGIVPVYRRIADAVHEFDVPVLAQLGHRGRRVSDVSAFLGRPVTAPSAVPPPADGGADGEADADQNKDERISMLEAFEYARVRVEQTFETDGLIATEHALLDDNGDGRGTREPGPGGTDGTLAGRIYFGRGPEATAGTVPPGGQALQARMEELRWQIDDLRARKEQEDPGEYAARMEELLIELAQVTRRLRALQAPDDQRP